MSRIIDGWTMMDSEADLPKINHIRYLVARVNKTGKVGFISILPLLPKNKRINAWYYGDGKGSWHQQHNVIAWRELPKHPTKK